MSSESTNDAVIGMATKLGEILKDHPPPLQNNSLDDNSMHAGPVQVSKPARIVAKAPNIHRVPANARCGTPIYKTSTNGKAPLNNTTSAFIGAANAAHISIEDKAPATTCGAARLPIRKPETTDADDFWHTDQAEWDAQLALALDPAADEGDRKEAGRWIRAFSAAGIAMERKGKGLVATTACGNCGGYDKDDDQEACTLLVGAEHHGCVRCRVEGVKCGGVRLRAPPCACGGGGSFHLLSRLVRGI
ncbi:hypothetical protein C1H76_7537 [Elsinoe australis]|uniref:Uncharacterized protein n=1 Tax=Elsinoe australis TaxID=40998 RepID=A0A4U7AX41_9PEZI|nr:hypothetical protein C1H76_7537 [Elsinoe australis]